MYARASVEYKCTKIVRTDGCVRSDRALTLSARWRTFQIKILGILAVWFTLAISLLTCLLFGLAPAVAAARPDIQVALKDSSRGSAGGRYDPTEHVRVCSQFLLPQ